MSDNDYFEIPDDDSEILSERFIKYHTGESEAPENQPKEYEPKGPKPYPRPLLADGFIFVSRAEFCERVDLNKNSLDIYRQKEIIPTSAYRKFIIKNQGRRRYHEDYVHFIETKLNKFNSFRSQVDFYKWIRDKWGALKGELLKRIPTRQP